MTGMLFANRDIMLVERVAALTAFGLVFHAIVKLLEFWSLVGNFLQVLTLW